MMIVKNEIDIHGKSVEYLKEVFSKYTEVHALERGIKNPIIHMYAKEDTYDSDGDLNGYEDAIFFQVHIFDTIKKTVYKGKRLHDGILPFKDLNISQIKIFKDLSTLICLQGSYYISTSFAAIDIEKI